MELFDTQEEQRAWERRAQTHLQNRQKLLKENERLNRVLAAVRQRATSAEGPLEARYLQVLERLVSLFLQQIERLPLDGSTLAPVDAATLGALEWGSIETQLRQLQLQALNLQRLHDQLETPQPLPAVQAVLAHAGTSLEAQAALLQFRQGTPALVQQTEALEQALSQLESQPLQQRLSAAREWRIPTLKGEHYRLEALLRKMPPGNQALSDCRYYPLEQVLPEAAPVTPRAGTKRGLTDRLRDLFKGP